MALSGFDIDNCVAGTAAVAGVGILEYVPINEVDVSTYYEAVQASNFNQQDAYGIADWYKMPYTTGTGAWSEEQQDDEQGNTFRINISATLPADSAEVRGELSAMRHHKFLVRIQKNGQTIVIGTMEQPLKFESRFESGAEGGDLRAHKIQFRGVSIKKAPAYVPVF